eukprot:g1939.t1
MQGQLIRPHYRMGQPRLTKNQRRRLKKREQKKQAVEAAASERSKASISAPAETPDPAPVSAPAATVEYVSAALPSAVELSGDASELVAVFAKFASAEELTKSAADEAREAAAAKVAAEEEARRKAAESLHSDSDEDEAGGADDGLSRRKRKLAKRLSVAELKQLVSRPEVVEAHDVTSADPRLLLHLKAYRNTVEVPRHWAQKRKYLQGKRGIEKPPFQLPDFISQTGIEKVRGAADEEAETKKLKNHQRARMAPKLGRIDIDYQVLHDAFFRFQTKPALTGHGDMYYEGKEFETKHKHRTPGLLSPQLKAALGMPAGAAPPPWLINMQRYGPPPAYPQLKLPGLSAPLPPGASFGYHAGGWGKPPVDEFGRPLYGDVFGVAEAAAQPEAEAGPGARWGEVEEEAAEPEEEEMGDEPDGPDGGVDGDASGTDTPMGSGTSSVVTDGLQTPGGFELRKDGGAAAAAAAEAPKQLYQIMEEQSAKVGGALMGSSHTYSMPKHLQGRGVSDGVTVNVDADELEGLDEDAIKLKYQEGVEANAASRDDMSDLIAQESRKRKRVMEQAAQNKAKKQ